MPKFQTYAKIREDIAEREESPPTSKGYEVLEETVAYRVAEQLETDGPNGFNTRLFTQRHGDVWVHSIDFDFFDEPTYEEE